MSHLDGSDDFLTVVHGGWRHQGNQQVLEVSVSVALQVTDERLTEEGGRRTNLTAPPSNMRSGLMT